jgi:hypothetical protein
MGSDLGKELAALQRLPVGKLRDKYAEVFGERTGGSNRPWLARRIAWRLQERAEGGLSDRAKVQGAELADDADLRVSPRAGDGAGTPPPVPHRWRTLGFRLPAPCCAGRTRARWWRSRSSPADSSSPTNGTAPSAPWPRRVTANHCNGFAFFGLAKRCRS